MDKPAEEREIRVPNLVSEKHEIFKNLFIVDKNCC